MHKPSSSGKMNKIKVTRTVLGILAEVVLARMQAKHASPAAGSLRWGKPKQG